MRSVDSYWLRPPLGQAMVLWLWSTFLYALAKATCLIASMVQLIFLLLFVFTVNLPFGYWRDGVVKFSLAWFVAVHAAVPLVLLYRTWFEIPFEWTVLPFAVLAYFAGQAVGARWRRRLATAQ